jgi:uncharacterized protein with PIN domain
VADVMLGRLARWLRLLGYDTLYDRRAEDEQLVRICRQSGRILLSRDRSLCARRGLQSLLVESDDLAEQLVQVVRLYWRPGTVKPRCPLCNGELQAVDKFSVEGMVPTYVWVTQEEFQRCPSCGLILWKGTHWQRIMAKLQALVMACPL